MGFLFHLASLWPLLLCQCAIKYEKWDCISVIIINEIYCVEYILMNSIPVNDVQCTDETRLRYVCKLLQLSVYCHLIL
jgi:hypothetical protein